MNSLDLHSSSVCLFYSVSPVSVSLSVSLSILVVFHFIFTIDSPFLSPCHQSPASVSLPPLHFPALPFSLLILFLSLTLSLFLPLILSLPLSLPLIPSLSLSLARALSLSSSHTPPLSLSLSLYLSLSAAIRFLPFAFKQFVYFQIDLFPYGLHPARFILSIWSNQNFVCNACYSQKEDNRNTVSNWGFRFKSRTQARLFGGELDSKLSWANHIQNVTSRANRMLGLLQRNLFSCFP